MGLPNPGGCKADNRHCNAIVALGYPTELIGSQSVRFKEDQSENDNRYAVYH